MKRNDWILASAVFIYSLLFYNQTAGINFLIFTIVLIIFLLIKNAALIIRRNWVLAALGSLLSGVCVVWHGNILAVVANVISLSILSALSFDSETSVVFSLLHSAYSYLSSPVLMVIDYLENKSNAVMPKTNSKKKIWMIIIPVFITLIFFFMYRSSSTLFDALASKINWDFISWNWIIFTLGGLVLLYGFFYQKRIGALDRLDANGYNDLSADNIRPSLFFGRELNIVDENFSGTLLFALLNLLLLVVNLLDVNFMFSNQKLPLGITAKQFLHQGTDMLITSIIVAIAIILFYFRGGLNFYKKNKAIKTLACIWVLQNAFMLFSTACRNHSYICEYGLTYKRIGVYVYLILTLVGLITTLVKIVKAKSNMYLFRRNGWIFYSLLIILTFPDWDRLITSYNVANIKPLDTTYLMSLPNSILPGLLPYYIETPDESKMSNDSIVKRADFEEIYCYRLYNVLYNHQFNGIRSWNYDDMRLYNDITSKDFADKVTKLEFSNTYLTDESLQILSVFNQITNLKLRFTKTLSIRQLECFPNLQRLDLKYNSVEDLSGIETFKNLEYLDIAYDHIHDFSPLYSMKKLKQLYVGNIKDEDFAMLSKELPGTHIERFNNL